MWIGKKNEFCGHLTQTSPSETLIHSLIEKRGVVNKKYENQNPSTVVQNTPFVSIEISWRPTRAMTLTRLHCE